MHHLKLEQEQFEVQALMGGEPALRSIDRGHHQCHLCAVPPAMALGTWGGDSPDPRDWRKMTAAAAGAAGGKSISDKLFRGQKQMGEKCVRHPRLHHHAHWKGQPELEEGGGWGGYKAQQMSTWGG